MKRILLLIPILFSVAQAGALNTPGVFGSGQRTVTNGVEFISMVTADSNATVTTITGRLHAQWDGQDTIYAVIYTGTAGDIGSFVARSTDSVIVINNNFQTYTLNFSSVSITAGTVYFIGFHNKTVSATNTTVWCGTTSDATSRTGYATPSDPWTGAEFNSIANCEATLNYTTTGGGGPPTGACCFSDGTCSQTIQANCSGVSWSVGVPCNPCPPPSGGGGTSSTGSGGIVFASGVYGAGTWGDTSTTIAPSTLFPLKISTNGRYLETSAGNAFHIFGEAAWSLATQNSYADAKYYLDDRASRGFNCAFAEIIEHYFSDHAPANYAGVSPWTGANFTTPNPTYFTFFDSIVTYANTKGICLFLFPIYIGSAFTTPAYNQGWRNEMVAASTADIQSWGIYIGNRYKNFANIVWVIGGDADVDNAGLRAKVDAFATALTNADPNHTVITAHGNTGIQSGQFSESWFKINGVYEYSPGNIVSDFNTAYAQTPTKPIFWLEGLYEANLTGTFGFTSNMDTLRWQIWAPFMRGGCGHFFGNSPIWYFNAVAGQPPNSDWKLSLNSNGSQSCQAYATILSSRAWYKLAPDNGTFLTANGTGLQQALANRASDNTFAMIYAPRIASTRTLVVNSTLLSGIVGSNVTVRIYNPQTGIGGGSTMAKSTTMSISLAAGADYVVVIE